MNGGETSLELLVQENDEMVLQSAEWIHALSNTISYLVNHDFQRLLQVLYRIDVSEEKLKKALANNTLVPSEKLIAEMIVKRMLQSLHTKKQWQTKKGTDNEEERW